jgi:hypothetical protein
LIIFIRPKKSPKPGFSTKPPLLRKKFPQQKRLPSIYGTVATFICPTKILKTGVFRKTPTFTKKFSPTKTLTVNLWDGSHFYLTYKNSQNRGFPQNPYFHEKNFSDKNAYRQFMGR